MFKFVELINTSNTRYLKNLGAFVYQAIKTRAQSNCTDLVKLDTANCLEFFECPAVFLSSSLLLQYVCLNDEKELLYMLVFMQ